MCHSIRTNHIHAMDDKEIKFVAQRYRSGKFSVDKGWARLNVGRESVWRRLRIAAAVASVVILSATAAVIYHHHGLNTAKSAPEKIEQTVSADVVKVIDFENTRLPVVIAEIKEVYGVEVINVPDNAEDYSLSLHYEGNAADLVAAINEILDTQMAVRK